LVVGHRGVTAGESCESTTMGYNDGERTRTRGGKVNQIISILVGVIVIIVLIYLLSSLL